jgi:hypothetical protein
MHTELIQNSQISGYLFDHSSLCESPFFFKPGLLRERRPIATNVLFSFLFAGRSSIAVGAGLQQVSSFSHARLRSKKVICVYACGVRM